VDALLATQLGAALAPEIDKGMTKPKADLKEYIDFDLDWRKIGALTAYGFDYRNDPKGKGVLLVTTTLDVQKGLEAAIAKFQQGAADTGPIKRLEGGPLPLYFVHNEVYVAIQPGRPVIAGKVKEDVLKARQVLSGSVPALAGTSAFNEYPAVPGTFFFLGVAQGLGEDVPVPPQAQVLKMADGLRAVLSETGGQVMLNAALKTKTAETSQKILQVLQGIIALGALSQTQNPDLQELVQGARVTSTEKLVCVEVKFPAARIIQKLAEQREKRKERAQ
jgi:hypothetical protein